MKNVKAAGIVFLLFSCTYAAEAAEKDILCITHHYLFIKERFAAETSMDEGFWVGGEPPSAELRKVLTLFTKGDFRFNGNTMTCSKDTWRWNGRVCEFRKEPSEQMSIEKVEAFEFED